MDILDYEAMIPGDPYTPHEHEEEYTPNGPIVEVPFEPLPDPSPPEHWGEWSMVETIYREVDHFVWYFGEWHVMYIEYTVCVYHSI